MLLYKDNKKFYIYTFSLYTIKMNFFTHNNVVSNIKWNAIESVIYSALMIGHQAALFFVLERSNYGMIGSIFSYIFFSELTLCLGLNNSAGTFFDIWSGSKNGFRFFFGWNILINYITSFVYVIIGYHTITYIPSSLYGLIACIIFFEQTKQICKTIMHILFKSKLKTFIELTFFTLFLIVVWASYYYYSCLSTHQLIIPFFATSAISCFFYIYIVLTWYKNLSDDQIKIDRSLIIRILKNRLCAVGNKTSKRFLSSNFLVPMIGIHFGMDQAAVLKIITQIAYYTTLVLRKTFGNASNTLFAHTKNKNQNNYNSISWLISLLSYVTGGIIGCTILIMIGLHWYLPILFTRELTILTIVCFFNATATNSLTTFEQWFIIYEKTTLLITAQTTVTLFWLGILFFAQNINSLKLLIIVTTCNLVLLIFFSVFIIIKQKNKIFSPKIKMQSN